MYAFQDKYLEDNSWVKSISEWRPYSKFLRYLGVKHYYNLHDDCFFQIINNLSVTLYFKVSWYFAVKYDENFFDDFYSVQKNM